jgi:hypothetical protein
MLQFSGLLPMGVVHERENQYMRPRGLFTIQAFDRQDSKDMGAGRYSLDEVSITNPAVFDVSV